MLRKNLLLTTAFVVATALSTAAAPARPAAAGLSRDSNNEFLNTYSCGNNYITVSDHTGDISGSTYSAWKHVAVPFIGNGTTVDTIVVRDGYKYSSSSGDTFSAGIYKNNASGFPGRLIAGGTTKATATCAKIRISIPPTKLIKGKQYWLEETEPKTSHSSSHHQVYWESAPRSKRKTYVQTHWWRDRYSVVTSSTTPWITQSGTPYFRLK